MLIKAKVYRSTLVARTHSIEPFRFDMNGVCDAYVPLRYLEKGVLIFIKLVSTQFISYNQIVKLA